VKKFRTHSSRKMAVMVMSIIFVVSLSFWGKASKVGVILYPYNAKEVIVIDFSGNLNG